MKIIQVPAGSLLLIDQPSEPQSPIQPDKRPMVALSFSAGSQPSSNPLIRFGFVVEPRDVEAKIWYEELIGRKLEAQVNVPEGKFDPLPDGVDDGTTPRNILHACWWHSGELAPPAHQEGAARWGKTMAPRSADVENGSASRVVVEDGMFDPLPDLLPGEEFSPPATKSSPGDVA